MILFNILAIGGGCQWADLQGKWSGDNVFIMETK